MTISHSGLFFSATLYIKLYQFNSLTVLYMRRIIAGLFCPMQTDNKIQSEQVKHTLDHKM